VEAVVFHKLYAELLRPFASKDVLVDLKLIEHKLVGDAQSFLLQFERLVQSVALLAEVAEEVALQRFQDDAVVLLEAGLDQHAKEVIDLLFL
jgi:hypothetical protein